VQPPSLKEDRVLHPSNPEVLSSKELVSELVSDAQLLIQRQIQLAKIEARQEIKRELRSVEWLGVGGAIAYAGLVLLLVAAALGIGEALQAPWAGALIVAGALLFIAAVTGAIGWSRRVKTPLERSQREVKKEITWAKHQATT
jgi:hypothetical protein